MYREYQSCNGGGLTVSVPEQVEGAVDVELSHGRELGQTAFEQSGFVAEGAERIGVFSGYVGECVVAAHQQKRDEFYRPDALRPALKLPCGGASRCRSLPRG